MSDHAKQIIYGVLFVVVGFALAPWWPLHSVEPIFDPGLPSSSAPMRIPFKVKNNSSLFHFDRLQIRCFIEEVTTSTGGRLSQFAIGSFGFGFLDAGSSGYYSCPIQISPEITIRTAKIRFLYSYYPNFRADGAPSTGESPNFTLDSRSSPARWVEGKELP